MATPFKDGQTVYRIVWDASDNPTVRIGKCVASGKSRRIKVLFKGKLEVPHLWHGDLNTAIVEIICAQRWKLDFRSKRGSYDPWLAVKRICRLNRLHDRLGKHGLIKYRTE